MSGDFPDRHIGPFTREAIFHFDKAVGDASANDDNCGHSNEFCIFKSHSGGDPLAIIEENVDASGFKFGSKRFSSGSLRAIIFAGDDKMHIGRSNSPRPAQPILVMV